MNVHLFKKPPYKLDDMVAVVELTRGPSVFVAANNAQFDTLTEVIVKAKATPNSIAYGGPGIGLPSHIAFELFQREAGVRLVHVPYKGSGPSLADALGGQIPIVSSTLAAALPYIKSKRLKALAVTSEVRWPALPETPTVSEIIGKPFSHLTILGLMVPKGTPAEVVDRINAEVNKILSDPAIRTSIEIMGTLPVGGTPTAFQVVINDEAEASRILDQSAGLRAD